MSNSDPANDTQRTVPVSHAEMAGNQLDPDATIPLNADQAAGKGDFDISATAKTVQMPPGGGDIGTDTAATMPLGPGRGQAGNIDPTVELDGGSLGSSKPPPERIGPYKIGSKLGQGGMGMVYRATNVETGAEVALKLLKPELAENRDFADRFVREAKSASKVVHENVVKLDSYGEDNGLLYMAFELLEGGDLSDYVEKRGLLSDAKAMQFAIEGARGLQAVHEAGLVHRDIKPGNMFMTKDGHVRIGDLGLARQADGDDRMTMTGAAMGTPAYMSPEHVRGIADLDIRTDIYAMGATLYKMCTGYEPYKGDTLYMVTDKILNAPVPDPRAHNPQISAELAAIIIKAMAKKREKRYQIPTDMVEDLEAVIAGKRLLHAVVPKKIQAGDNAPISGGAVARGAGMSTVSAGGLLAKIPRPSGRMIRVVLFAAVVIGAGTVLSNLADHMTPRDLSPAKPAWAAEYASDGMGHLATFELKGETVTMRWCVPGTFTMGSPLDERGHRDWENQHQVEISEPFWIADAECTQRLWQAVMEENPSYFEGLDLPVESVSWDLVVNEFLPRLNAAVPGLNARLPTEAEWEYACRAGTTGAYAGESVTTLAVYAQPELAEAWADFDPAEPLDVSMIEAVFVEKQDEEGYRPAPVQSKQPNPWGIFDMHGNVGEWVADGWTWQEPYPVADLAEGEARIDPVGMGDGRVVRGGSWFEEPLRCRAAARLALPSDTADYSIGFRIAVDGAFANPE